MKPALVLVAAFVAVVAEQPDDNFTRYKNINIEEIVSNDHLLKSFVDCFLGTGTCTAEGTDIKTKITLTAMQSCSNCSAKQKPLVAKMMHAIKTKFPEDWEELDKIYNPGGKYDTNVSEFLKKYES